MPDTFANPVLPGFQPDPSVCRVGGDYYLATSSFELFPGLPIHHSRDLVNWRLIGHALGRRDQIDLSHTASSKGIFAPTLRHHQGRFYLVCTDVDGWGNFIVHATDPAGPWSDPIRIAIDGIDPSLCFHEKHAYLTVSASGQSGIWGAEIDPETGHLLTAPALWWRGTGGKYPEGPHLYHRDGWFYLLISEGGTEAGHMITVARSRQPEGPYAPAPHNPLLSHRSLDHPLQSTGHADLVQAADNSWWMVFLATRPLGYHGMHHLGRETCLTPVEWPEGGWPRVAFPLPLTLPRPPTQPTSAPLPAEASSWVFRRTPPLDLGRVDPCSDVCVLPCLPVTLDQASPCAFLARRQTSFNAVLRATVELSASSTGDSAGLAVVMNEHHHVTFLLRQENDGPCLSVLQRIGDLTVPLASHPISATQARLRIRAEATRYHFEFSASSEAWITLASASPRHLSTELAGGFTGVLLGLHATSTRAASTGSARFTDIGYQSFLI